VLKGVEYGLKLGKEEIEHHNAVGNIAAVNLPE